MRSEKETKFGHQENCRENHQKKIASVEEDIKKNKEFNAADGISRAMKIEKNPDFEIFLKASHFFLYRFGWHFGTADHHFRFSKDEKLI